MPFLGIPIGGGIPALSILRAMGRVENVRCDQAPIEVGLIKKFERSEGTFK